MIGLLHQGTHQSPVRVASRNFHPSFWWWQIMDKERAQGASGQDPCFLGWTWCGGIRRPRKTTSIYSGDKNWKTRKFEPVSVCVRSPPRPQQGCWYFTCHNWNGCFWWNLIIFRIVIWLFAASKSCMELCPHGQHFMIIMKLWIKELHIRNQMTGTDNLEGSACKHLPHLWTGRVFLSI